MDHLIPSFPFFVRSFHCSSLLHIIPPFSLFCSSFPPFCKWFIPVLPWYPIPINSFPFPPKLYFPCSLKPHAPSLLEPSSSHILLLGSDSLLPLFPTTQLPLFRSFCPPSFRITCSLVTCHLIPSFPLWLCFPSFVQTLPPFLTTAYSIILSLYLLPPFSTWLFSVHLWYLVSVHSSPHVSFLHC